MISDRKKDVSEGNLTERRRYQTDRRSFLGQKLDTKKGISDSFHVPYSDSWVDSGASTSTKGATQ